MTTLINRSQEASKSVQDAVLVIPSMAIKLTGEAFVNAKAVVIAFKNVSKCPFTREKIKLSFKLFVASSTSLV